MSDEIRLAVEIENTYADGEEVTVHATAVAPAPDADEPLDEGDEWVEDNIFPLTGTGRGGDAWYTVTVQETSRPDLIGVGRVWEWNG